MSKLSKPKSSPNIARTSRPSQPFQAYPLQKAVRKQAWLILLLLLIGMLIDWYSKHPDWIISKNILAGSVLAWVGQLVFAKISLSLSGYRQRRQIVHRFYAAHLIKWVLTLIGFVMIFKFLMPLRAMWVFIGFMLLQVSYTFLMYQQRKTD